ncbi:L-rhamnose-binding lectin CSL3-like [Siniperca chuatsi]|uniref:L-rhamnose-binding lectin CSL3-like n=1 Tax=Siniperca chuatsi TaxID=119488 RepID=UPI001CE124ED|nr:L-rhamnose-binding lectin CSL3-like [Siniperca chuatsi]XP_044044495.1 L-rhamnose-binding lectin CSL3-like [Siniperca chuatsi]
MITRYLADKMLSTRLTLIAFLAAAWCWTSDGQLYYMACPGERSELQCPEGHLIEVLSLHHGVIPSGDCTAKSQLPVVSAKDCLHKIILQLAKFACDDKEQCRLPMHNAKMFKCDYSEDSVIRISYQCNKRNVLTTSICQGQTQDIKCDNGALNILKASFGRQDNNTCTEIPSKASCLSYDVGGIFKSMCNSKNVCTITSTPYVDETMTCDLPTYLTVDYVCE